MPTMPKPAHTGMKIDPTEHNKEWWQIGKCMQSKGGSSYPTTVGCCLGDYGPRIARIQFLKT